MKKDSRTLGQRAADRRDAFLAWIENGIIAPVSRASGKERLVYALSCLSNALLLGMLAVSAVFCLVTAMKLPLYRGGGTAALIMLSAFALMIPYYLPIRNKTLFRINTGWVLIAFILCRMKIFESFCSAFAVSTAAFGKTFGFDPVILYDGGHEVLCDQFVTALGILLALCWAGACAEGRINGMDVTLLTLTLTPCMIIKEYIPSARAIVLLTASISLVLLSGSAKWSSRLEGSRVLLRMLLPAALLCLLPFWIEPPESYQPKLDYDRLSNLFTEYYNELTSSYSSPDQHTEMEDLSKAGSRRLQSKPVMQLYTERGGVIYLKGSVMANYSDGQWTPLDGELVTKQIYVDGTDGVSYFSESGDDSYFSIDIQAAQTESGEENIMVSVDDSISRLMASYYPYYTSTLIKGSSFRAYIKTYEPGNVLYYPYFPDKSVKDLGCEGIASETYIPNPDGLTSYDCGYKTPEESLLELSDSAYDSGVDMYFGSHGIYTKFAMDHYTEVQPEIYDRLLKIASDNGLLDLPKDERPAAVINYVRTLGTYDLNTPAVKNGEDFALWFLESSHRGYCVHFATAAALLMRVCGIPSRYVSGYMTYAYPDKWNEITSDEAHAWVEIYRTNVGWIPLEATASSGLTTAQSEPEDGVPVSGADVTGQASETATQTSAQPSEPPEISSSDGQGGQNENVSGTDRDGGSGGQDGSGTAEPEEDRRGHGAWLLLLIIPAAAGTVFLRRYLELSRRRALYEGGGNNCALQLWTECEALSAIMKLEPAAEQRETAVKAAFSRHTVSREEIMSLERYRDGLIARRKNTSAAPVILIDRFFRLLY